MRNGEYFSTHTYSIFSYSVSPLVHSLSIGHDHDGLGFHYHMTINENMAPVFPYTIGPKYYGCLLPPSKCLGNILGSKMLTSVCGKSQSVPILDAACKSSMQVK